MPPQDRSYGTVEVMRVRPRPVRRSCCGCTCAGICGGLIAALLFLVAVLFLLWLLYLRPFVGGGHGPPQKPDFSQQNFAVGFDLTAGYGTAAVNFPNGTTSNICRADGTAEYNQLMAKLSLPSSQHPTPPYYGRGYQADLPRQILRKLRMTIGLPASEDVATLAGILKQLKESTEQEVGPFQYAFVTVPHLPAFYNEDLVDACRYVGLQYLTLPWYVFRSGDQAEWPVTEVNTAMAGNGVGICKDLRNAIKCVGMIHCDGNDNIFSVLYTAEALTAHVSPICAATHFYSAGGIANFSLGYQAASSSPNTYWPRLRAALKLALDSYQNRGHELRLVVAHGEGIVHEPGFMTLLQEEVQRAQYDGKLPNITAIDPVYAAARGAAHFGRECMLNDLDCIPDLRPKPPGW